MIFHGYRGTEFKSHGVDKVQGMNGWFVTGRTEGGFAIVAKEDHGKGFSNRNKARKALRIVKETGK